MRRLLGCVGATLLLTACNLSSHVVVHPDGSGDYAVTITAPAGSGESGDALYTSLKQAAGKAGVPLNVTKYVNSGESGAQAQFSFRSLADLTRESAALSRKGTGLSGVHVSRGTQGWHFDAASTEGLVTSPGAAAGAPGGDIDASALAGLVHVAVVVELPGQPGESNANAVTHNATDSTFTWDLAVGRAATPLQASTSFVGDQSTVRQATALTPITPAAANGSAAGAGQASSLAHSSRRSSSYPAHALSVGLGLGCAAAVLLGVGIWALVRSRRRSPTPKAPSLARLRAEATDQ